MRSLKITSNAFEPQVRISAASLFRICLTAHSA
jgi:hypothetical protein